MRAGFGLVAVVAVGILPGVASAASAGKNLGAVHGGDRVEAVTVIEERCLRCHNKALIEKAAARKRDMAKIVKAMEGKGAALSDHEREVLQHFWKAQPFKGR